MNGKISVIIPVYNVAAYLPECLESVLSQDYCNLEIILIDDGSTDDSGRICDEYAAKDGRINVIHQANGGAAAAKNAGLRVATGQYLAFLDSDDYLESGAYSYMAGLLETHNADIVQCRLRYVYKNKTEPASPASGLRIYSGEQYVFLYTEDWTCALMTDKVYKRELFAGVFFEEGHAIDDEFFTYQGAMNANKVVCEDRIVYNYRMRSSSVMHSTHLERQMLLDTLDYMEKRRRNVIARFPSMRKVFNSDYLDSLLGLSRRPCNTEQTIVRIKKLQRDYFKNPDWTIPGISSWPAHLFLAFATSAAILKRCDPLQINDSGIELFE